MSIHPIPGIHRGLPRVSLGRRMYRSIRNILQTAGRSARRTAPERAESAYAAELLTPRAAALHVYDDVRVIRHDTCPVHVGREGTVVSIASAWFSVSIAGVGILYCERHELLLVSRAAARTLTMDAIVADLAPERAW